MRGLRRLRALIPLSFFLFAGAFGDMAAQFIGLGETNGALWLIACWTMGVYLGGREYVSS